MRYVVFGSLCPVTMSSTKNCSSAIADLCKVFILKLANLSANDKRIRVSVERVRESDERMQHKTGGAIRCVKMLSNGPLRIQVQVQHLDRFAIYFGDLFNKVNQATLGESSALFFSHTCPIIAHGHLCAENHLPDPSCGQRDTAACVSV